MQTSGIVSLIIGFFWWGGGFWISQQEGKRFKVKIPIWLHFLCGFPHPKGMPKGVINFQGLVLQLAGLVNIIYALLIDNQIPNSLKLCGIFGAFAMSAIIGGFVARWFLNNHRYP
jgi:hypothetical protein